MPARPMPVEPEEKPASKPEGLPDGVWLFPEKLAALATVKEVGRQEIAKLAGVTAGTVSRWLHWQGLGAIKAPAICRLEEALDVPTGTLLGRPGERRNGGDVVALIAAAAVLGLDLTVAAELTGGGAMALEMKDFGNELKRAVLGAVHLLGHPLEVAVPAAHKALKKTGPAGDTLNAEAWLGAMREFLPPRPASGTFPSSGKIQLR